MAGEERMAGWVLFAGVMMILAGLWGVFEGLIAVLDAEGAAQYVGGGYVIGIQGWGIVHLAIGALIAIAGLSLLNGKAWARLFGIVVVGLNMIGHMFNIGAAPAWSLIVIALDVVIICALCVYTPREIS